MKTTLNKSAKRALSLVLALVVAIGSLFVANVGVSIKADAATLNIKYWDGNSVSQQTDLTGGGTVDNPYLIKTAADFAFVATGADGNTKDEYYKIDDGIDAIVLQPETYGAAIMALDSAANVRTYFEANKSSLKKWKYETATAGAGFNGHFDGNGAIIAGMYTNTSGSIGLFTNLNSSTIENVIIKNNYACGDSAAIICSFSKDTGAVYNFNKCELTNNVVIATRLNDNSINYGGLLLAQTTKAFVNIDNCIIYDNITTHSTEVTYWIYETAESAKQTAYVVSGYDITYGLWGVAIGNSDKGATGYHSISNSLILDTLPNAVGWDYNGSYYVEYDNVYTNMTDKEIVNTAKGATGSNKSGTDWTELTLTETYYTITTPINANGLYDLSIKKDGGSSDCAASPGAYAGVAAVNSEGAKGSLGKLAMNLNWATDEEDGTWYAIDGEYPTLFKPEGWKDCETIEPWNGNEADFTEGTGVEGDPYIIETPEQLWKMVKTGGKVDGVPKYYKVKDGVENLYLSKAISGGYAAVKALAGKTEGTDYHNWITENPIAFVGNFDGNGVTIRGMISITKNLDDNAGLLQWLGTNAVVKNINFDTCYAYDNFEDTTNSNYSSAAMLASMVTALADNDNDGVADGGAKNAHILIYNIAVRNSYSKAKYAGGVLSEDKNIPDMLQIVNSIYDGYSCQLEGSYKAGIYSTSTSVNNLQVVGCVSLNANVSAQKDATGWTEDQYAGWQVNSKLTYTDYGFEDEAAFKDTTMAYNDYRTGIDGARYVNHTTVKDEDGNPVTDEQGNPVYEPSRWYWNCHPVFVYNTYTDLTEIYDTTAVELVDENGTSTVANIKDAQELMDAMPLLDWANSYYVVEAEDGRVVPMPRVRTAADIVATYQTEYVVLNYAELIGVTDGGATLSPYQGTYGQFDKMDGSGTEADPYIIKTDKELARVVAAGGTAANNSLYFKLANDIDLTGMPWISTIGYAATSGGDKVVYVPFVGTLDGDGHTITGLYAVNNDGAAGLIPELAETGVVKNLHIRNGYAGASEVYTPYIEVTTEPYGTGTALDRLNKNTENPDKAGAIAGKAAEGSQIIGCSVENTIVINTDGNGLVGNNMGLIVNSYIDDSYYNDDGAETTADAIDLTTGVWYKGGYEGAMPKLVNRAKAMEQVDVSGMGDGDYDAYDLTALQNKLLNRKAYKNIYGDVNRNGVTNIADLVVLRRAVNQSYNELVDGFWRNVELGNIAIYYSENDTQDMARKLELYFEGEVAGIDMHKYAVGNAVTDSSLTAEEKVDAAPTQNAIVITQGDPTQVDYNKYSVTFDDAKNLVTIYGGSFTAVEQAVINFMANSSRDANIVYTVADGDILTENKTTDIKITATEVDNYLASSESTSAEYSYKQRVTVGGKTYYYAWGDEFMDNANDTITSDNWKINAYRGEDAGRTYLNQENANLKDIKDLWVVNEGRLQIWRGVNTDTLTSSINGYDAYSWGYKPLSLGKNTKNDFGSTIDEDDVYIDPGMITTVNSMLFKQGYVEMEASLPSDGHAFPAWWFLTYNNNKNNTSISNSLYGKIFKFNNVGSEDTVWDKKTTGNFTPGVLSTYKYQVPTAHLEFDIVEPMQYRYNGTETSAYLYPSGTFSSYKKDPDTYNHYKRDFNLTVHKIYNEHSKDDVLSIVNWDENNGGSIAQTVALDDFNTTTTGDFIHKYDNTKYGGYTVGGSWINTDYNGAYKLNRKMTQTVKYGFAWYADASNGTYGIDVYVDGENVMSIDKETGHASDDYLFSNSKDAETWNQYAYMLIDNCFYTANAGAGEQFTDLLTQDTSGSTDYSSYANYQVLDKTTFEINYVRVYQEDGKRDIVTPDTEAFNNGNHYGYGS